MSLDPSIVAIAAALIGGGGVAGALIAYRRLPSEIESISVTAAQGAVTAQGSVIERQQQLIDQLEEELRSLRGRLRHEHERALGCEQRERRLQRLLLRHGIEPPNGYHEDREG